MDVRVSAVTPTPVGNLDIGKHVRDVVSLSPLGGLIGPILDRVLLPTGELVSERIGKLVNVTVIVINDSTLTVEQPQTDRATAPTKKPPKAAAPRTRKTAKSAKAPARSSSAS